MQGEAAAAAAGSACQLQSAGGLQRRRRLSRCEDCRRLGGLGAPDSTAGLAS